MQALSDFFQSKCQTIPDGLGAKGDPFRQQFDKAFHTGFTVQADDVHINPEGLFHFRGGEQVCHEGVPVHPVGAGHDNEADRVLVVGFVPEVRHHGQLFLVHLGGDLFQHLGRRHLVGQGVDDDVAVFQFKGGTHADDAFARSIDGGDFGFRCDDFGAGRVIRSQDVVANVINPGPGVVDQVNAGVDHFLDVVGRDIRGHTHGDAGGAVEQDVGKPCRQHPRFL